MSPLGSKLNFGQMIESCTFNLEKGDAILAKKQDRDIEPLSEAVWTMGVHAMDAYSLCQQRQCMRRSPEGDKRARKARTTNTLGEHRLRKSCTYKIRKVYSSRNPVFYPYVLKGTIFGG